MAVRCGGITRSGTRCQRSAEGSNGLCWAHDPTNAEQRRRQASKAGRAKPDRKLAGIKARLSDLADDVLEGRKDRAPAAVAGQLLNTYIRAVGVELKAKEQLELIERLETLEENLAANAGKGGRRWGA